MRSKLSIQNLAIGGALIGTLFQPAFASDSKVYPGGLCQATNGKHEVNLFHGGTTFNNQTSKSGFVRVTCPIVRDSVSGTNGFRAIVNVSRNAQADPNQALICRVSTLRKDGQTFVTRSFSHRGSDTQTFSVRVSPGFSGGPYVMRCDLPFHSSINSYYIEEL